jgi:hypothetical protein
MLWQRLKPDFWYANKTVSKFFFLCQLTEISTKSLRLVDAPPILSDVIINISHVLLIRGIQNQLPQKPYNGVETDAPGKIR